MTGRGRVHQGRPLILGQPRQEVPDVGARDADRRVVHSQLGGGRERVFSLLKLMFGDTQMSALADMIQTALMLKYNQRKVG
mgnify:CR=1 FL=1